MKRVILDSATNTCGIPVAPAVSEVVEPSGVSLPKEKEEMKRIFASKHRGGHWDEDICNIIGYAIRHKDVDDAKEVLEDLREGYGFSISKKTYRGNYYELSIVYLGNDKYEITWTDKGKPTNPIVTDVDYAVGEIMYWGAKTGGPQGDISVIDF